MCKRKSSFVKRVIVSLLGVSLLLPVIACDEAEVTKRGKFAWIDSNITDNQQIVSTIRLEDDFAAAANAEWLANETFDVLDGNGTFEKSKHIVDGNLRALLDNEELNDKNLELLRAFDSVYSDGDYRKEIGTKPLEKYLGYIDEINSIDDVKNYMLDNSKNPFAVMLVNITPYLREESRDYYTLIVSRPDFSLGEADYYHGFNSKAFQQLEKVENNVSYILKEAGYSDKEINKITSECFEFETKMASFCKGNAYVGYYTEIITRDEIIERAGLYPLKEMFEHYDLMDSHNYSGDYTYLEGIGSLLTESNLEGIKSYFKVRLILNSQDYLDRDIFDYCDVVNLDKTNKFAEVDLASEDRYLFYTIRNSALSSARDQAYIDYYFDEETYNDLQEIVEMYIDAYKDIIAEKDWLSDENKANIYEKLDNIAFDIILPSNEADYSDMTILTKEEGGTLLDAWCEINKFKLTKYGERTSRPYDRTFWDIYDSELSTTDTGALYDQYRNVIVIKMGIVCGDFYSPDMPFEEKLGHIGAILGHELSHAFDSGGVYRDKNGDTNPIIVGDDMSVFNDKADKVMRYYANIRPFDGCDAYLEENSLSREAIADMGGVKSSLVIASKQENFDYDLFFRSYADLWKSLQAKWALFELVRTDGHPLRYLRVNVTLQQFDEFYETYDVKPGDNMYLAPEDRIAIW